MSPDSKRIPLAYAHKKERDTFYEVNPVELPPVIRQNLNPRHKPKVRVTTDQRTGEVLAKIIKCRVADIDVYSPRTTVDWRVSVNLEMEYEGDYHSLPVADAARGGRGERNKDRMSYRHLAYQVDLTQVARAEVSFSFNYPVTARAFSNSLNSHLARATLNTNSKSKSLLPRYDARAKWPRPETRRISMKSWSRDSWITSVCWHERYRLNESFCVVFSSISCILRVLFVQIWFLCSASAARVCHLIDNVGMSTCFAAFIYELGFLPILSFLHRQSGAI